MMLVGAGDPVGGFDSKTARNSALFWCSVRCGVGDELAVVEKVGAFGDCKIASSAVGGLAWTRVTSFTGPTMLKTGVCGVV